MESATRELFNACDYLLDRQLRAGRGGAVALRVRGRSTSYAELHRLVCATAAGLRRLSLRPEERVLLVLLDGVELVAGFLAALRLGAIALPVNPLLPVRDVAGIAADARARVVLVAAERAVLLPELAAVPELVVAGDAPPGVRSFAELAAEPAEVEPHPTWPDSPGFWLATSGTTGRPKLAMHRHADLRVTAEGFAREVLEIGPDDRCYSAAPLFHAYGLGNALTFPLSAGAASILEPARPPNPALAAELLRSERPTLFFAVPTFYAALLAADLPADAFASVRLAVSAGEALPAELFLRFRERFGVEILDGIGSTELTQTFISNRAGRARPGSAGTPVGGYRVRLEDDAGDEVLPGTPGYLWVAGESAATGYWCRAAETRRTFRGEWVRTGDVCVQAEDGSYVHLGRSDDLFKVGGEWVSPAEVEAVLAQHPDVLEAAVVPGARAGGVLEPVAYVVPAAGLALDADALAVWCRDRLAGFKRPRRVLAVPELPKTATGKIRRRELVGGPKTGAP